MVLHCDSPASCYIWKQKTVAVGQFDRNGDKNKLYPLFPIQTEMFPKEWGKGTSLQGGKVLRKSKIHCVFSIRWCHNWLNNVCTQLQMGIWNFPTLGTAAFTNVQLKEKSKFKMKEVFFFFFFCLPKSTHEAEKNWSENLRPRSLRFPVSWVVFTVKFY